MMPNEIEYFRSNDTPTLGTELELMIVDPRSLDLTAGAVAIQRLSEIAGLAKHVKLEVTQSMIELNSSVHERCSELHRELVDLGRALHSAARVNDVLISGGGTHPFHRWQERMLSPTERFHDVGVHYGYLAKQFTVFGQHVHVGCRDGDDAVRAVHALSLFVPQIIALAAASPYHRGVDTAFDSCRLNMIAAFPLSGRMPGVRNWREFVAFYTRVRKLGIVSSIKDFYWDVRPQPEFGTVELRVPDTPLEVESAADLAAYAQVLVEWSRRLGAPEWVDDYVYRHNRFEAARFGFDGQIIIGPHGERVRIADHLRDTFDQVAVVADELHCEAALARLMRRVEGGSNDALWLRQEFGRERSLPRVVASAAERWAVSLS